jgi:SAM-dependent methyltransferase
VLQNALLDLKTNNPGHSQLIADLGCGAGNLSLPLAWWLRSSGCRVRGVDLHSNSLKRLAQWARDATVDVEHLEMDLLLLMDTNDANTTSMLTDCSAVVSLHACGAASDMSIAAAIVNSLPFAVSPCCIGKVKNLRPHPGNMPSFYHSVTTGGSSPRVEISFPRSIWLREAVTPNEYQLLAAAADYGGSESVFDTNEFNCRQRCREAKRIVEIDRLRWAQPRTWLLCANGRTPADRASLFETRTFVRYKGRERSCIENNMSSSVRYIGMSRQGGKNAK